MPLAPPIVHADAWPRAVLHCDMDSFYVAVHRQDHPEDSNVPLVVGGSADGRGVVASASYEARRFGVRSAMPTARAVRLCPGLKVVGADWSRIKESSRKVMAALAAFGPIETMSVDEAYVDVTDALAAFLAAYPHAGSSGDVAPTADVDPTTDEGQAPARSTPSLSTAAASPADASSAAAPSRTSEPPSATRPTTTSTRAPSPTTPGARSSPNERATSRPTSRPISQPTSRPTSRTTVRPPTDDPAWLATAVAMGALPEKAMRVAKRSRRSADVRAMPVTAPFDSQSRFQSPSASPAPTSSPTSSPTLSSASPTSTSSRTTTPPASPTLDVSPAVRAFAESVRQAVIAATGLPASVGLAPNKGVAKVASDHDKPEGTTVVPPGTEAAFLAPMPVRAIHGVGPRTAERLGSLGIETCAQLAASDPELLASVFGSHGEGLCRRALGRDDRPVHAGRGRAKSISAERTFRRDVADEAHLLGKVDELAEEIARSLAKRKLEARTVVVKFRWADFTTYTRQRTTEIPVSSAAELSEMARAIWREHWPAGKPVRLVGVGTAKLSEKDEGQLKLWG